VSTSIPEAPTTTPSQADVVNALQAGNVLGNPAPALIDRIRAVAVGARDTAAAVRVAVINELRPAITASRARGSHTGTQTASTISDFPAAVQVVVDGLIKAGSNVTIGRGSDGTLTVNATATGGGTVDVDGETIRDTLGATLRGGQGIQVFVDDDGDTVEIRVAGLTAAQITDATTLGNKLLTARDADGARLMLGAAAAADLENKAAATHTHPQYLLEGDPRLPAGFDVVDAIEYNDPDLAAKVTAGQAARGYALVVGPAQ